MTTVLSPRRQSAMLAAAVSDEFAAVLRGVHRQQTTAALQAPRSAVTTAPWPMAARSYELPVASPTFGPALLGHEHRWRAAVCSPVGGTVTQHVPFANQPMLSGRNVPSLRDATASRFNKGINSQQPAVNSAPTPTSI